MTTISAVWREAECSHSDAVAMVAGETRFTYRELGQKIRGLAYALSSRWHVHSGTVVALLAPNCPEFVVSYFAAVTLGAVIQPIDERLTDGEIKLILSDSRADILIVHGSLWRKYEPIRNALSSLRAVIGINFEQDGIEEFGTLIEQGDRPIEPPVGPSLVAELMYTSGTTGEPKGVMRSHANVIAAARNAIRGFGYRERDVIAIVMPLSHSSALNSQMVPMIHLGGTLVLLERFDVNFLLEAIERERVSCMRATPAMLRLLLSCPTFCAERLSSLRLIVNSSGPIDPNTFAAIKHRFARVEVMNSYGLTEASTCTVLRAEGALEHPDSIGQPIEGVEMALLTEDGRLLEGENSGEICVRGEHVFVGYYARPHVYRAVFTDGWLRTGDVGRRDSEGYYYLYGRTDDVINSGGHKYAAWEVEDCILQMIGVADVAVVGKAHSVLGEVGKAYVVPRNSGQIDAKQVVQHCTRSLPSYKIPFYVEIVRELPKNAVGKILRRKLKEKSNGI